MNVPKWFETSLSMAYTDAYADLEGRRIHYRCWGDSHLPGIVLVHGGVAHLGWWQFLAPLLTHHYYVVAIDLSGHGESDWRDHYSVSRFAEDIHAVCHTVPFAARPILVGHSMGGLVSLAAAARWQDMFGGAVIVDSPVRQQDPESREGQYGKSFCFVFVYATPEEAMSRFRLVPEQPCDNKYIMQHIARTSIKQTDAGWTWKFDPNLFVNYTREPLAECLPKVKCRIAMMRGEFSTVVPPETSKFMYQALNRVAPLIEIPQAHHHLILDQPLAFIAALRAILADWEHSDPRQATVPRHQKG